MNYQPYKAVWEITNACNAKCIHCGSSSGKRRENELTKEEALRVCDELKEIGCKYVTLIGGEFFLSPYWEDVCERLINNGIRVAPLSNGILVNKTNLKKFKQFGIKTIFISIDGLRDTHDYIRGIPGLFDKVIANIKNAQKEGFRIGINTSVSKVNLDEVTGIYELCKELGVISWQIQIVEDIGNAQDNPELKLQIEDLYQLLKNVAQFRKNKNINIQLGDNVGFYASFEPMLRDKPFTGCAAGRFVVGIEASGNVRGCLSVMGTPETTEGNVRERSLVEIWNDPDLFSAYRQRTVDKLKGFCAECEYRNLCRGGCSSLSFALTGAFYENPFCIHKYEIENGLKEPSDKVYGVS